MSESEPTAAKPDLKATKRWNLVWVIPILAVFIGSWMIWKNISSKGAEIQIHFETADGIIAGKTEIKCRSVTVGKVTKVELAKDLQSVAVTCTMNVDTDHLLRKGTLFWVVRPRVSAADVSGLGTLLTGVYVELDPGDGAQGSRKWMGLETPPATSKSVPGLRMTLVTEDGGSLSAGAPIYYRGFEVGRIESRKLDSEGRRISFSAFIGEEYQTLVHSNTKFWNTSGVDISAGVDGLKLRTPSFQSMVSGGVSFALLEGDSPGPQAQDGSVFDLHEDAESATSSTFEPTFELLLLFDQSVRGLRVSAPVEYRGIEIGRVKSISFDYALDRENKRIPVLVEVDPSALRPSGASVSKDEEILILADAISKGLRASLKTGSYFTGAMFVDFDYYPDEMDKGLSYIDELPVLPTMISGLAQLEVKLVSIMEKIEALPLDEALENLSIVADESKKALAQIEGAAAAAREVMENPEFKALPAEVRASLAAFDKSVTSMGPDGNIQGDLLRTLDEFRSAVRSVESMTDTIEEKPNSLLFGKEDSGNPIPKAAPVR